MSLAQRLRKTGVGMAEGVAPRLVWKHHISAWGMETGEAEEALLPSLCDRHKVSVDIGAAHGAYTAHMLLHSRSVVAFEVRPDAALHLTEIFANTRRVRVESVALSDHRGTAQLRTPDKPMLATIEPNNQLAESAQLRSSTVDCIPLDAYNLQSVGFIKIDVEGHEWKVLCGAKRTIESNRPKLMIEVEVRHNPTSMNAISEYFGDIGYKGWFLLDGSLIAIENFDLSKHQSLANLADRGVRTGTYVNNFIFVPS
jgi:FkbM family methyltransferase